MRNFTSQPNNPFSNHFVKQNISGEKILVTNYMIEVENVWVVVPKAL